MSWQREPAECDVFVSGMIYEYAADLDRPVPAQKFKEMET